MKQLFDEIIVIKKEADFPTESQPVLPKKTISSEIEKTIDKSTSTNHFINIEPENKHRMKVFVPYWRKNEIAKIRTIQGRAWNIEKKYWSVPMSRAVVQQLNTWFAGEMNWTFEPEKILAQISPASPSKVSNQIVVPFRKVEVEETASFNIPTVDLSVDILIQMDIQPIFQTIERKGYTSTFVSGHKVILTKADTRFMNAYVPGLRKGWIEFIRSINGRQWNIDKKCWRLPMVQETFIALEHFFKDNLVANFTLPEKVLQKWHNTNHSPQKTSKRKLNEFQQRAMTALEEKLMLEHKRHTTIKTYKQCLKGLFLYYPNIKPSQISKKQIEKYMLYNIGTKKVSRSTQGQIINALNAFYVRVLDQIDKVQALERPKKQKKLPNVLSPKEIETLIKAVDNLKHKCLLILIYSGGLRKGEVLNLQVNDLNAERKMLFIRDAKGGKDRYTFYSDTAIKYVEQYIKAYQPKGWLFQGQTGGKYSATSLQKVFQKAKDISKVNPRITIHGLRHSFAAHLVEKGVPLHAVQELLGHYSIKTTEVYLHISNRYMKQLESPLKNLDI